MKNQQARAPAEEFDSALLVMDPGAGAPEKKESGNLT